MNHKMPQNDNTDAYTRELIESLFSLSDQKISEIPKASGALFSEINAMFKSTENADLTAPIIDLFIRLKLVNKDLNITPDAFGISKDALWLLAKKHQDIDEHGVSVGGRVNRALLIVEQANERIVDYLSRKTMEAPSGIELWDNILENGRRIRSILNITDQEWNSYSGQLKHCIDSVEKLSKIKLPRL